MAAPGKIGSTAPVSGLSTTSHASTSIGDLVVCITFERAGAGIPTHTINTAGGFVEIFSQPHEDGSTDGRLSVAYKVATAAGAQAYAAYTTSGSGTVYTGSLVVDDSTYDILTLPTAAGVTQTNNAVPNPPSVAGLTGDFLILNIAAWHLGSAGTNAVGAGANYIEEWELAGSADIDLALALRSLTGLSAATEDPPAWTDAIAPNGTSSITIALKGVGPQSTTGAAADGSANANDATVTIGAVSTTGAAADGSAIALDATASNQDPGQSTTGPEADALADAQDATTSVGPVTTTGVVGDGSASGIDATTTPGAVSSSATQADAQAAALDAGTTPGAIATTGAAADASASALDAITSSGANATGPEADATASGLDATTTPGAVSTTGPAADASSTANDASITVGGVGATGAAGDGVAASQDADASSSDGGDDVFVVIPVVLIPLVVTTPCPLPPPERPAQCLRNATGWCPRAVP